MRWRLKADESIQIRGREYENRDTSTNRHLRKKEITVRFVGDKSLQLLWLGILRLLLTIQIDKAFQARDSVDQTVISVFEAIFIMYSVFSTVFRGRRILAPTHLHWFTHR
ncbi:hypothetical protein C492_08960 [Natronococcus jeotgali DSM 18795]|uniref:Uncharacterized protein n=1 Tax=Natronococcus jeotgali DSM 18795 TaxID=1227498 RepID=L9XJL7_9EURY|nr:hypothetical protein C492_08960 [Natronococcus jeotgali DSM 18795]